MHVVPRQFAIAANPKAGVSPIAAVQRYIERLEELSNLYEEKKVELMQDIIAVERAISDLPPELRMLMRYRYIYGLEWETVQDKMGINKNESMYLHRKAKKILFSKKLDIQPDLC